MGAKQLVTAAVSFARALANPRELTNQIAFLDAAQSHPKVMGPLLAAIRQTGQGRIALRDRPRLGHVDLDALAAMPKGTLGHEYAHHMRINGLDPAALPDRSADTDAEFVLAHGYETHDIWHAVTGFAADDAGELGLASFVLAQLPARTSVGALAMCYARVLLMDFDEYAVRSSAIARGWLLGRRAQPLFGIDWKQHWGEPMDEVRRRLELHVDDIDHVMQQWDRPAV